MNFPINNTGLFHINMARNKAKSARTPAHVWHTSVLSLSELFKCFCQPESRDTASDKSREQARPCVTNAIRTRENMSEQMNTSRARGYSRKDCKTKLPRLFPCFSALKCHQMSSALVVGLASVNWTSDVLEYVILISHSRYSEVRYFLTSRATALLTSLIHPRQCPRITADWRFFVS